MNQVSRWKSKATEHTHDRLVVVINHNFEGASEWFNLARWGIRDSISGYDGSRKISEEFVEDVFFVPFCLYVATLTVGIRTNLFLNFQHFQI